MARNVQLQILRGVFANIPSLADGEFYFADDKGQLYLGFGGINFKIGSTMAAVEINGNANPTHYIEPNADGSVSVEGIGGGPVPTSNGGISNSSLAVWNSSTAVNTVATILNNSLAYGLCKIGVQQNGTVTGGVAFIQGSLDGVSWYQVSALTNPNTFLPQASWVAGGSVSTYFTVNVTGIPYLRLLLTSAIVGSGTITVQYALSAGATNTDVAIDGPITLAGGSSTLLADVQAKGTQGTFALATQDLKDSGRLLAVYSTTVTAAAANTEELASLTPLTENPSGTLSTGSAASNFTVPAGKRFRIQTMLMAVTDVTTAEVSGSARITLRIANNAAITVTSSVLGVLSANFVMATAVLGQSNSAQLNIADGLELSGTENFGITYLASTVECSITISLIGYFY